MNPIDQATLSYASSYQQFRARVTKNAEVFDEVYAQPAFDAADLELFRRLPPLTVVVIAEDWCPDVCHTLPTWVRLAEELGGWRCWIFQRDQDPPLIESFLHHGSAMRIPVYAFYDQRNYLQTWWSGRGAIAQHTVEEWLAGRAFAEMDDASREQIRRLFDQAYRRQLRRANFVEIKTQLAAFFHLD